MEQNSECVKIDAGAPRRRRIALGGTLTPLREAFAYCGFVKLAIEREEPNPWKINAQACGRCQMPQISTA